MAAVTQRIKQVKQPYGGYLKLSEFSKIEFDDGKVLGEENIHSSLVGMAVDYLTRVMLGTPVNEAFKVSILGAKNVGEYRKAYKLLRTIKGIDKKSIRATCKIVGYDVCYRTRAFSFNGIDHIKADNDTIRNIQIMIMRSLAFFEEYGPVTKDGFSFERGYTSVIDTGDGDFLTADTLWDLKTSKRDPTTTQTLQLLVYYIMGKNSIHNEFDGVEKLGIFNPRQNLAYLKEVRKIPDSVIAEVSSSVIGYSRNHHDNALQRRGELLSMAEIMRTLAYSRYMVMKYYAEYNLPLVKVKNRYMITENNLATWLENIAAVRQQQKVASFIASVFIIIAVVVAILICLLLVQDTQYVQ